MGNYKVTGNYKPEVAGLSEQAEASSTPITDDAQSGASDAYIYLGNQITLPTTEKFYKITALECKNGTTATGNMVLLAVVVDAQPPVGTELLVAAYTPLTAQSGTSAVQKVSVQSSLLLAGGAKITGALISDAGSGQFRYETVSSQNVYKIAFGLVSPPIPIDESISWGATTRLQYLKIYYRGYS